MNPVHNRVIRPVSYQTQVTPAAQPGAVAAGAGQERGAFSVLAPTISGVVVRFFSSRLPSRSFVMSATLLALSRANSRRASLHFFPLLAPIFPSNTRPFSQTPLPSTERSPRETTAESSHCRKAHLSIVLQNCGLPQSILRDVLSKNPLLNAPHHSQTVSHSLYRLKETCLSAEALTSVLKEAPGLLMNSRSAERGVEFLERMGFTKPEINRICRLFPRVLMFDVESRLRPLFEEFGHFSFSVKAVQKVVVKEPGLILGMEAGEMLRYNELLASLKCRVPIKERIFDQGLLCAIISVKRSVDCLCQHGLIRREALGVIWREPRVLIYGLEDISKKIHYLLITMGFKIDALVDVPQYLGVNLDKQIIPRYQVVEFLRSMGALDFDVTLWHIVKPSKSKFYNMFVKPYPECEQLFKSSKRDRETERKHVPTGLWKLFNPSKYPKSDEDVHSMKIFIDSLG